MTDHRKEQLFHEAIRKFSLRTANRNLHLANLESKGVEYDEDGVPVLSGWNSEAKVNNYIEELIIGSYVGRCGA